MIRVETKSGVVRISLARPEKRNALTPNMLRDLRDAMTTRYPDVGAILLLGEGRAFCAGFDLDLCRGDGPEQSVMHDFLTLLSATIEAMVDQHLPVVLCAHGAAIAGGCALLGGADVVITDAKAKLGYPVTRLGISPAISAPFLSLGVGLGATRARLLDSGLIDGDTAVRLGLAHRSCVTPDDAIAEAERIALNMTQSQAACAATKQWCHTIEPPKMVAEALNASLSLIRGDEATTRLQSIWKR